MRSPPRSLLALAVLLAGCSAPSAPTPRGVQPGTGECSYESHQGTCTVTRVGLLVEFTFAGKVDGDVSLAANTIETGASKLPNVVGESAPCVLELRTSGGCDPCVVAGGTCGKAAQALAPRGGAGR